MLITVAGIDPSLRHTGLAKGTYDTETGELLISNLLLINTENESGKSVRQNSDDLRCCAEITSAIHIWLSDCAVVFAEMPTGGQSASAAKAFGMCIGILSSIGNVGSYRGSLVQVTPSEVKKDATGSKNATKQEMIDWAVANWPNAPWRRFNDKPTGRIILSNEHLADACGAINAGIKTNQFKNLVQMLRSLNVKN